MRTTFDVWHYETLGSTNDEARRMARQGAPHGTVLHADKQTSGRGRLSRSWFSPPGNLYLSILLRTGTPPARSGELSFLAALAVADTIEAVVPQHIHPMLKWPNDVLINGAKVAGILAEQEDQAIILGVGLNVLAEPPSANYKTTTIAANGGIASVDSARDILLDRLGWHLEAWFADGFAPIRELWLTRSCPLGTSVRVRADGEPYEGLFGGLDCDGAMLLDTPEGRQRVVAGDVRIKVD